MKKDLTEEQNAIVTAPLDLDIRVDACPGSGKTYVICQRVVFLKEMAFSLADVAVFTFNRSLGRELSHRLGSLASELCHASTLHSFIHRIAKNDTMDPQEILGIPELKGSLKYIIFDEYQDASRDMTEAIKYLSGGPIMIVGDPNQQINGWRGSSSKYLADLREYKIYPLTFSFRCSENICSFLSSISSSNIVAHSGASPSKEPIHFYCSEGKSMHHPYIIDKIIEILKKEKARGRKTFGILSPILSPIQSKLFLNDLKRNIATLDIDYKISSIHQSKGLEYDAVILLNALDAPNFFGILEPEGLNKFFVACSRARDALYIFEHRHERDQGSLFWCHGPLVKKSKKSFWNKEFKKRQTSKNPSNDFPSKEILRRYKTEYNFPEAPLETSPRFINLLGRYLALLQNPPQFPPRDFLPRHALISEKIWQQFKEKNIRSLAERGIVFQIDERNIVSHLSAMTWKWRLPKALDAFISLRFESLTPENLEKLIELSLFFEFTESLSSSKAMETWNESHEMRAKLLSYLNPCLYLFSPIYMDCLLIRENLKEDTILKELQRHNLPPVLFIYNTSDGILKSFFRRY